VNDIWLYRVYKDGEASKRIAGEILKVGELDSIQNIEKRFILVAVTGLFCV
jgi:hypothetical protein